MSLYLNENLFCLPSSRHKTIYANGNSLTGAAMQNTKAVMKSKNVHSREIGIYF